MAGVFESVFLCAHSAYPRRILPWGLRCACLGTGWGFTPPNLAWVSDVRLVLGFGCTPPILAGVLGCVCWCACSTRTLPFLAWVCGAFGRIPVLT